MASDGGVDNAVIIEVISIDRRTDREAVDFVIELIDIEFPQ